MPQPNTSGRALWLLGEIDLSMGGPTTPEVCVILQDLRSESRRELAAKEGPAMPRFEFCPFRGEMEDKVEALAESRLEKAMAEAGLA